MPYLGILQLCLHPLPLTTTGKQFKSIGEVNMNEVSKVTKIDGRIE